LVCPRVLVGPAVPDVATLDSLLARLAHYFAHVEPEVIAISIGTSLTIDEAMASVERFRPPAGFAAGVERRTRSIASVMTFIDQNHGCVAMEKSSDVLLLWQLGAMSEPPWGEISKHYRHHRTQFVVDWSNTRQDGIWFAEAALAMSRSTRSFNTKSSERFRARTHRLRGVNTAYLVGTGPSARAALDLDMSDGARIVCNTVVIDDELMAHVRPHIVTFADPIFHFGPSTYAAAFQGALVQQADRYDFTIVTTERYAALLAAQLPQLSDRIVGVREIPIEQANNFDLIDELAVRPYPNIVTMLMLPLAATFSDHVTMIGFDGRAPDETYFWRHGSSVQFDRELAEIRSVHPGFFDLDYADYYAEHVNCLEAMLTAMERRGIRIDSSSPSYMRPLRRRSPRAHDPLTTDWSNAAGPTRDTIISITPDWVDDFGHFGRWERTLRAAAGARGYEYRTLASKALASGNGDAIRAFTHPTLSGQPFDAASFETELRDQLAAILDVKQQSFVCFYTADLWHLPAMLAVAAENPETLFAANLMRAHQQIADALRIREPWSAAVRSLLTAALEAALGTNLVVCIDTDAAAEDVRTLTGFQLPVWPMMIVADRSVLRDSSEDTRHSTIRVLAPIQTQGPKGFDDLVAFAERVSARLRSGEWSLTTRLDPIPTSRQTSLLQRVERFVAAGGEVVEGSLSDEQFARMLGTGDVILLPYHNDVFRTRTSGLFLDAIGAGKPTVTVRGTWPGDLVERFRIGRTFREQDVGAMVQAVEWVTSRLAELTEHVVASRDQILEGFAPDKLVDFFVAMGQQRRGQPPAASRVAITRALATTMLNVYWDRERRRAADEVRHNVALDELRRSKDDHLDTIESLARQLRIARAKTDDLVTAAEAMDSRSFIKRANQIGQRRDAVCGLDIVAQALQRTRRGRGIIVDVGVGHRSSFVPLLDAHWTVYTIDPRSGRVRVRRLVSHHDGHAVIASRLLRKDVLQPGHVFAPADGRRAPLRHARIELHNLRWITRVDLLNIGDDMNAMAVLDGVPWERLRPSVIVVPFDDSRTATAGYSAHDVVELLSAYGYHLWASAWWIDFDRGGGPAAHRVVEWSVAGTDPRSWGHLLAFIEPVSPDHLKVEHDCQDVDGSAASTERIPVTGEGTPHTGS
jgi:hypothetical protein